MVHSHLQFGLSVHVSHLSTPGGGSALLHVFHPSVLSQSVNVLVALCGNSRQQKELVCIEKVARMSKSVSQLLNELTYQTAALGAWGL